MKKANSLPLQSFSEKAVSAVSGPKTILNSFRSSANKTKLKALSNDASYLATCNAILLLGNVNQSRMFDV